MTTLTTTHRPATSRAADPVRLSTRFGLVFTVCHLVVMAAMAVFVLPHEGSPSDPALARGQGALDAVDVFRLGNFVFMVAGTLLLGFLGAVYVRLKKADGTGTLAAVALASGALLALIWPLTGVLHDVALDTAVAGADVRILAGFDAVAPYGLAFSVFARVFFVGSIALALRAEGNARWLVRAAVVVLVLSLAGSATLLSGAFFPLLAIGTLGYELWIGALAWRWLRDGR